MFMIVFYVDDYVDVTEGIQFAKSGKFQRAQLLYFRDDLPSRGARIELRLCSRALLPRFASGKSDTGPSINFFQKLG